MRLNAGADQTPLGGGALRGRLQPIRYSASPEMLHFVDSREIMYEVRHTLPPPPASAPSSAFPSSSPLGLFGYCSIDRVRQPLRSFLLNLYATFVSYPRAPRSFSPSRPTGSSYFNSASIFHEFPHFRMRGILTKYRLRVLHRIIVFHRRCPEIQDPQHHFRH